MCGVDRIAELRLRPIGFVRTPYADAGAVPKGRGTKHVAPGTIEILPEFAPGLRDIEGFSHLYVLWVLHLAGECELVGRNPTDGREHGVFATRSPRRPNPLALSVVELLSRAGARLHVRGVDMVDGSPVLDLKPYLSSVPPEQLRRGWLDEAESGHGASPAGGPATP